jgi:hypothetical protein
MGHEERGGRGGDMKRWEVEERRKRRGGNTADR